MELFSEQGLRSPHMESIICFGGLVLCSLNWAELIPPYRKVQDVSLFSKMWGQWSIPPVKIKLLLWFFRVSLLDLS